MELKEGMYVRTKDGFLSKIEFLNSNAIYIEDSDLPLKEEQIKARYKPIDLIEVGDYVNGKQILDIKMKCDNNVKCLITKDYDITNEMIKSIVTKEQFEAMQYKVMEK